MSRLQESLDTATDRIEAPPLAAAVLAGARRRRSRRQGAVAAVAASVVVAATVGTVSLVRPGDDTPAPAAPSATRSSVFDLRGPDPTPSERPAPHPDAWDPRTVDDLPLAPRGPVALPAVISPPDDAPALADAPVEAVKVAIYEDGEDTLVFSTSGEWRSVPTPGAYPRVEVSPEGTRLLVWWFGHDRPVEVVDVTTGSTRAVDYPEGYDRTERDFDSWQWLDEGTAQLSGGWRVDMTTGAARATPYPRQFDWVVDPAGEVVELATAGADSYDDWAPGGVRGARAPYDLLYQVALGVDVVAGLASDSGLGVDPSFVVVDRATFAERGRLPVRDADGVYTNWGGGALAVAPGGDVLLRIASPDPRRSSGDRVVRWDPETDDLELVTTVDLGPMPRRGPAPLESWAAGLLRQSVP